MPDTDLPSATNVARSDGGLTRLEWELIADARAWAGKRPELPGQLLQQINAAGRRLMQRALSSPRVAEMVDMASTQLLEQFDPEAVRTEGPRLDPDGHASPARRTAALKQADGRADMAARRFTRMLGAQGAATGAASINLVTTAVAMAGDITASTVGLLHAAAEVLAAYGPRGDDLRTGAVRILLLVGEREPERRRHGLLVAAGIEPAPTPGLEDLAEILAGQTGPRVVNEAIETIIRRRVRARLLLAVPAIGAVIGAATSMWMTSRATEAAKHVGRLTFLHRHAVLSPNLTSAVG
ncbi:MAG: hypothetical protein R3343_02670 [Nitriliruptorales bacterium]|nr:hypothetical protein [Nitriliruptorales bacterium]